MTSRKPRASARIGHGRSLNLAPEDVPRLAAAFTAARRAWLSKAPSPSASTTALALIFLDGMCLACVVQAALVEIDRQLQNGSTVDEVLDLYADEIGWRSVVLSDTTRQLAALAASHLHRGPRASLDHEIARLVGADSRLAAQVFDMSSLLRAAAAYVSYHAPAVHAAYATGRYRSRATTRRSRDRILERQGEPTRPDPGAPDDAATRLRMGSPVTLANGLLQELGRINRLPERGSLRRQRAVLAVADWRNRATDAENGTAALMLDYIGHLLGVHPPRSVSTIMRYASVLQRALSDTHLEVSVDDTAAAVLTEADIAQIQGAVIDRFGTDDAPAQAAMAWLAKMASVHRPTVRTEPIVEPADLVCQGDIDRALAIIRAHPALAVWHEQAACALIAAGAAAGLRVNEALHLRQRDVALQEGRLHITVSARASGLRKSPAAERVVQVDTAHPMGAIVADFVRSRRQAFVNARCLFSEPSSDLPARALAETASWALAESVGSYVGFHKLRHHWATTTALRAMLDSHKDESIVQKRQRLVLLQAQIGHANLSTTLQSYVHFMEYIYADWMAQDIARAGPSVTFLAAAHGVCRQTIWRRQPRTAESGCPARASRVLQALTSSAPAPIAAASSASDARAALATQQLAARKVTLAPTAALRFVHLQLQGMCAADAAYLSELTAGDVAIFSTALARLAGGHLGQVRKPSLSRVVAEPPPFAGVLLQHFVKCDAREALWTRFRSWYRAPDEALRCEWPRDHTLVGALLAVCKNKGVRIRASVYGPGAGDAELLASLAGSADKLPNGLARQARRDLKSMGAVVQSVSRNRATSSVRIDLTFSPSSVTDGSARRTQPLWNACASAALITALAMVRLHQGKGTI